MTAFEVLLNGEKLCVAGIDGPGVISLSASWIRREKGLTDEGERLDLNVGGLNTATKEYVDWLHLCDTDECPLAKGDELILRIVESSEITPPTLRPVDTLQQTRDQKERYLQELAAELGWTVIPPEPV